MVRVERREIVAAEKQRHLLSPTRAVEFVPTYALRGQDFVRQLQKHDSHHHPVQQHVQHQAYPEQRVGRNGDRQ